VDPCFWERFINPKTYQVKKKVPYDCAKNILSDLSKTPRINTLKLFLADYQIGYILLFCFATKYPSHLKTDLKNTVISLISKKKGRKNYEC